MRFNAIVNLIVLIQFYLYGSRILRLHCLLFVYLILCTNDFLAHVEATPPPNAHVEDTDPNESEVNLHAKQKHNSTSVINKLQIKPTHKSCISIPLCHMIPLPLVRPINELDVQRLKNEFVIGYHNGHQVMYVSMFNNKDKSVDVSTEIFSS